MRPQYQTICSNKDISTYSYEMNTLILSPHFRMICVHVYVSYNFMSGHFL